MGPAQMASSTIAALYGTFIGKLQQQRTAPSS
jgi:hypothetical protein